MGFLENFTTNPSEKQFGKAKKEARKRVDYEGVYNYNKHIERSGSENPVESLAVIALQLKEKLHTYDTILGDDASGRIPALIFRNLIKDRKQKAGLNTEIQTLFLAHGRHGNPEKTESIQKLLSEKSEILGKVLLITEYVDTGGSIYKIIQTLKDLGADFDVATVSQRASSAGNSMAENLGVEGHYYFGERGQSGLAFHSKAFTGVQKDGYDSKPFSKTFQKLGVYTEGYLNKLREDIVSVRENDVKIISQALIEMLDKQK